MPTINEYKKKALNNAGFTGDINTAEYKWLRFICAPYKGAIPDMWRYALKQSGYTGSLVDMQYDMLVSLGYTTGSMPNKWYQYWKNTPMQGVGSLASLFLNGENGFLFGNFSEMDEMYTNYVGPVQVSADNDITGLLLDDSRWSSRNLTSQLASATEMRATYTLNAVGSPTPATYDPNTGIGTASRTDGSNVSGVAITATSGKWYMVEIEKTGGAGDIQLRASSSGGTVLTTSTTITTRAKYYVYLSAGSAIYVTCGTNATSVNFVIYSVKELVGNHFSQVTSANRPLWRSNSGKPYLQFDGTNDSLNSQYIVPAVGTVAIAFNASTAGTVLIGGGNSTGNKRAFIGLATSTGQASFGWGSEDLSTGYGSDLRGVNSILLVTSDGVTRQYYVNGVLVNSAAINGSPDGTGGALVLGGWNNNGSITYGAGNIFAALTINRKVTTNEISLINSEFQKTFPVAPPSLMVTINGETFSNITGAQSTGNFVDGVGYIVVPTGTATIGTSPVTPSTQDGYASNGAMKNPIRQQAQAWDERMGNYNAGNLATFPMSVTAGDVVVIAKSRAETVANFKTGIVEKYLVLHVVAAAPAADTFAPAAIGWSGRGTPVSYTVDITSAVAALPSYSTTGHSKPSYAALSAAFCQHAPTMRFTDDTNTYSYERHLPKNFGGGTQNNYGRFVGSIIGAAGLGLISDAYTSSQKRELFIWMVRHGIDALDTVAGENTGGVGPDGGHWQYHLIPEAVAAHYTGRHSTIANLATIDRGNGFGQHFLMNSTLLADCAPHDNLALPHEFRRRTIPTSGVTGNDITLPVNLSGNNGDPNQLAAKEYLLTRESDNAQGTITLPDPAFAALTSGVSTRVATIASQPGSPFIATDVVYLKPPYTLASGQYHWAVRGAGGTGWSKFAAHKYGVAYRDLNSFGDEVLVLRALSLYDDSMDAIEGYVCAVNEGNYPSPTHAFPSSNGVVWVTGSPTWTQDFWTAHAETIIPRLGFVTFKEDWSTYTNGDTWTQVDAQYSRSSALPAVTISTDASAPGGLSAAWGKSGGNHEWAWRDDIATALAARTTERVQVLIKERLTTVANTRGGFGYSSAADVHTGLLAQRFSSTNHSIALQLAGNPSTSTNSAALLSNRLDNDLIWTRIEIDGQYIKGRSWIDGGSEPGTWTATLDNVTPISLTFRGPTIRTGGLAAHQFLYYSVGIGGDAPSP